MQKIKNVVIVFVLITFIFSMIQIIYAASSIEAVVQQSEQEERNIFNAKYTKYTQGAQSSQNIKTLMTEIRTSNTLYENHQVAVKGVGSSPEELEIKIDTQKQYTVVLEYGQNGYVTAVVVEEYVQLSYNPNNQVNQNNQTQINIVTNVSQNKDIPPEEKDLPDAGKETGVIFIAIVLAAAAITYLKYKRIEI